MNVLMLLTHLPVLPSALMPIQHVGERLLIIEPMHGLANRLRAYASAKAVATASGRKLVVVWRPDVHCNAEFGSLFENDERVLSDYDREGSSFYDYMVPSRKYERIHSLSKEREIYVRSAYLLNSDVVDTRSAKREVILHLRNLVPTQDVRELMVHPEHPFVSVHSRCLVNQSLDIPGIEGEDLAVQSEAPHYRSLCSPDYFSETMRSFPNARFLISVDNQDAISDFKKRYPDQTYLPVCDGKMRRGVECIQAALASILSLSKGNIFIQSVWSSFSEVISLIGDFQHTVYGCDTSDTPTLWEKTSVVAACRNRPVEGLVETTIRATEGTSQFVLVDWGSEPPIPDQTHDSVHLYRVVADSWILSHAYNFAFSKASGEYLLKLDCDTRLDFLPTRPEEGTFLTGSWEARGKEHTNGIFFSKRGDLKSIGFFDERIVSYGWDDSDLYERLQTKLFLSRRFLNLSSLRHEDHTNMQRAALSNSDFELEVETQKNRICTRKNLWNGNMPRIQYTLLQSGRYEASSIPSVSFQSCDEDFATGTVLEKVFHGCSFCVRQFWFTFRSNGRNAYAALENMVGKDLSERCISSWKTFDETDDCIAAKKKYRQSRKKLHFSS